MIGKSKVDTEYIGLRRHFRNSYFASLKQILSRSGCRTFVAELITVEAVAMVLVLYFVFPGQSQERLFQTGTADLNPRNVQIQLEQSAQDIFHPGSMDHGGRTVLLYRGNARHLLDQSGRQLGNTA